MLEYLGMIYLIPKVLFPKRNAIDFVYRFQAEPKQLLAEKLTKVVLLTRKCKLSNVFKVQQSFDYISPWIYEKTKSVSVSELDKQILAVAVVTVNIYL